MSYTARLTITIPVDLYDIGCAIARSLDPDVGGADSFGGRLQGDPPTLPGQYTTTTPCTPAFLEQAMLMSENPQFLHAAVTADYASRWPDLTPPTLAECEAFCAGAVLQVAAPE